MTFWIFFKITSPSIFIEEALNTVLAYKCSFWPMALENFFQANISDLLDTWELFYKRSCILRLKLKAFIAHTLLFPLQKITENAKNICISNFFNWFFWACTGESSKISLFIVYSNLSKSTKISYQQIRIMARKGWSICLKKLKKIIN